MSQPIAARVPALVLLGALLLPAVAHGSQPNVTYPVPGAEPPWDRGPLRVSENGRYLENHDGSTSMPFFWFGDTAWLMPHRLTIEEAKRYFSNRKRKGFTVVQVIITGSGSIDGLVNPAHSRGVRDELPFFGKNGREPRFERAPGLMNRLRRLVGPSNNLPDPTRPNEAFFEHIDNIIDAAEKSGLYIVLSPTWGRYVCPREYEKSYTPVIFDEQSAHSYGRFLGDRYKNRPNIIWLMGGDRDACSTGRAVWDALAGGIESTGDRHLVSYHPSTGKDGYTSSGFWLYADNGERYPSWLDFNMSQPDPDKILEVNTRDYRIPVAKPTVVGESNYFMQQEPFAATGEYAPNVIRAQTYWAILSGAAGYTYGNNHIWWFDKDDGAFPPRRAFFREVDGNTWTDKEYLDSAGTQWAVIWKDYFSSIDWWNLVPDQDLIGKLDNGTGVYDYPVAARMNTGDRVFVYFPNASPVTVDITRVSTTGKRVDVRWLNTRDGSIRRDGIQPWPARPRAYTLPSGWEDGLLILQGQS